MHDHSQFIDVVISAGSNIEKERNLAEAIRLVRRHRRIDVKSVSRFFESASVGGPDDAPPFFNAAVIWVIVNAAPWAGVGALSNTASVSG